MSVVNQSIWACEVAWISYWPSEPVTRVRIPAGPLNFKYCIIKNQLTFQWTN